MSFIEQPTIGGLVESKDGFVVPREFNGKARSKVDARLILRAQGIFLGAPYRDFLGETPDPFVVAEEISINALGTEIVSADAIGTYQALITYRSQLFSKIEEGFELTPDGPAIFKSEASLENKPVDVDIDGNLIGNSAGVPFNPPATAPFPNEFIVAEFIRSNLKFGDALIFARRFRGTLNSKSFKGANAKNVLCHDILPEALNFDAFRAGGLIKFIARFEFARTRTIKSDGKDVKVTGFAVTRVDQGRQELNKNFAPKATAGAPADPPSQALKHITIKDDDDIKIPVSEDVRLDGKGKARPLGDQVVRVFDVIEESDFNLIKI